MGLFARRAQLAAYCVPVHPPTITTASASRMGSGKSYPRGTRLQSSTLDLVISPLSCEGGFWVTHERISFFGSLFFQIHIPSPASPTTVPISVLPPPRTTCPREMISRPSAFANLARASFLGSPSSASSPPATTIFAIGLPSELLES